jgi:Ala-tRNA(Pro) deacylase
VEDTDLYARLLALLDQHEARYRVIDHVDEGRTEAVSVLRGHPTSQAAKCVVLIAKQGKKTTRFILAVIPGDMRVAFDEVKRVLEATYVGFADARVAERLAGSVSGTILPFAFDPTLELIADPAIMEHAEIYFNAARLDRSLALDTTDYAAIAKPRVAPIARR